MGRRLKDLTSDVTKCMIEIDGTTLAERMLRQLDRLNLSRIVLVIGYQGQKVVEHVSEMSLTTPVVFVENDIYDRTNNIYSLYLARRHLLEEDTLLLESDLIFQNEVLDALLDDSEPNLALVAKYESWMDGTAVILNDNDEIMSFIDKRHFRFEDIPEYHKTVNIYKFSKEFSSRCYVPLLETYSRILGDNEYYEQILHIITLLNRADLLVEPAIRAKRLEKGLFWYEIDDLADLDVAKTIFAHSPEKRLERMQGRYGGYWRYPHMLDFCYLVTPHYPPKQLMDEIKSNMSQLIRSYPSGQEVNCLLAAKYFGIPTETVVVGNGASEIIKSLLHLRPGKLGMVLPTFEEYPERAKEELIFRPNGPDYRYGVEELIAFFSDKDLSILLLINPDNPTGNYVPMEDVFRLAEWAEERGVTLVVDESFADFVDEEESPTLLQTDVLNRFSSLIVVKSISKSYGVPGLRLGVLASRDEGLINDLRKDVSIWNINSLAEFYLQIWEKYKSDFARSILQFREDRRTLTEDLAGVPGLRPIPSQANYIMCELTAGLSATELTMRLLDECDIFIKDLTGKRGIEGDWVRLAVRDQKDNSALVNALREIMRIEETYS